MDGIIIKPEWLAQIYEPVAPFTEPKTWEIRGSLTNKRGRIYLLESGSGLVTGETTLVDCIEITSETHWNDNANKHQVIDIKQKYDIIKGYDFAYIRYKGSIYAWILKDTVKYVVPFKYEKPKGAIIWVKDVEKYILWKQARLFDNFVAECKYFNGESDVNNGYGCNHPDQKEIHNGCGCCYCFSCPLGYSADENSLSENDILWKDEKPEAGAMEEDSYIILLNTKEQRWNK